MLFKKLLTGTIFSLIGVLILLQTNVVLAIASDPNNPITAAITSVINNISDPVTSPIVNPSATPAPTQSPIPSSTPTPVIAPVIDTIFPNPATWGTVIVLTGSNLTNSAQIYVDNSLIPPSNYKPVSQDGKIFSLTLPAFTNYRSGQTYKLYVVQDNIKSNELNLTIAPSVRQDMATPSATQVLIDPQVNLDTARQELLMVYSNFNVNLSIPRSVNNPTLNFSPLLITSNTENHAIFNNALTINTNTSLGTVKIEIPTSTQIMGPNTWNGVMNAPKILANTSATPTADAGTTAATQSVIEVGFGDMPLTFDKAVRILIPNQAGKLVGYQRGLVFTKIATSCSADTQTAGDNLPDSGDCYIGVGNDLIIWTKHFTKFATYTQTATQGSNSSSSQSTSGGNAQAPVCGDSKPVSAPKLVYAAATGRNEVTLVWSKASDPVSYYLVAYGTRSNQMEYGNPNIGNKDTISYVVRGLSNGKTYYFKIRAGNGCMPGEFSNEIAVKVSGNNLNSPAAIGFKSGVLSQATSSAEFKPITAINANRIATSSASLLTKIINFFTRLFKS